MASNENVLIVILKLSGLIMASRVDIVGDNRNAHVIISNYDNFIKRGGSYGIHVYWSGCHLSHVTLTLYTFLLFRPTDP